MTSDQRQILWLFISRRPLKKHPLLLTTLLREKLSPNWISTSSGKRTRSAPLPSHCETACAARNLPPEMAEEVIPKNIIMIGPTGVGKTEIARRLAKLANSPFMKVEASKFTEVGYVGRDVESMIRDLVEIAIEMVREEKLEDVSDKAELNAEERLLDILLPPPAPRPAETPQAAVLFSKALPSPADSQSRTREKLRQQLREGKLDDRTVEIDVRERNFPAFEIITNQGVGGDGHQHQGHVAQHLRPAHQEAQDEGQ